MPYEAGAGRGMQGGPTAKELQDYEDKLDAGIFTAEKLPKSRMAPRDLMPEDLPSPPRGQEVSASSSTRKVARKAFAKGGSVSASSRADGCAQRGKTRGKMV